MNENAANAPDPEEQTQSDAGQFANEQSSDIPADTTAQSAEEVKLAEPITANETAKLRVDLEAAESRAVRAYADLENYKKRFDRELARQRDVERERFLNEVLAIADNLRRALKVKGAEDSPYREGLMSVMRYIDSMLKGFGVETMSVERGQAMNPNLHEAITAMTVEGAEHESILEIVEPGYMIGEKVLRPARVVVNSAE